MGGPTDTEGTGSWRSQESGPRREARKGGGTEETVALWRLSGERASGGGVIQGQVPWRVKGMRTEVSIESANKGTVGIFVRRFWRSGERQAMAGVQEQMEK